MFSLFKFNNPGVVIFYVVYLVLFRVVFLFFTNDTTSSAIHNEPLSRLIFVLSSSNLLHPSLFSISLSAVLSFVQALLVNRLVNNNKIHARKNYTAGAVFIIMSSLFTETLWLSPESLALTFVIAATGRLFSSARKEKAHGNVFDVGFLIALASLFYFPCTLLLLAMFIGMALVRPFAYREWLIMLIGFITPFFLVFAVYYWYDGLALLPSHLANVSPQEWMHGLSFTPAGWYSMGAMVLLSVSGVMMLPYALYSSLIQVRKFSTVLSLFVFLIPVSFLLLQTASASHFVLLGFPAAVLLSMLLTQIKRELFSEVIHLILILLVLAGQALPVFLAA